MKDEENKEKSKGEMLRVMRSGKRQGTSFVLLLLPLFIIHPSAFILLNTQPLHLPERAGFPAGS